MGILANTTSICQFRVVGDADVRDLITGAGDRLAARGFRSIDHCADELSVGWVQIDDAKESGFEIESSYRRDHYLTFTLRRDQRRLPPALLRAHLEMAEHEFLAANPSLQRVPKQKKEELREAVRCSLLAKTLPSPAIYDVVWDTRSGLVTLASLNPKVVELFETLFKQTFEGLRLVSVHPYARAEKVGGETLASALQQANRSTTDAVLDQIRENGWLGRDFLLWLMFRTMNGSSEYAVNQDGPAPADEPFVAYLNDRLVLLGHGDSGVQKITVAGPQDNFSEVRTALQNGKDIVEAILCFEKAEHAWRLTLKGETFHFAAFKSPAVKLEKDDLTGAGSEKEALFYERMYVLEEGLQLFDSLFAAFLAERLGEGWSAEAGRIGAWLAESEST